MDNNSENFYKENKQLLKLMCSLVSDNQELKKENEDLKTKLIDKM